MSEDIKAPAPCGTPDTAFLKQYLAEHDAPCPACRYNLRGCTGSACPECGESIALFVGTERQRWVPPVLAFLAFGWVAVAGLFNGLRAGRTVYYDALFSDQRVFVGVNQMSAGDLSTALLRDFSTWPQPQPARDFFDFAWTSVPWELWWPLIWAVLLLAGGVLGVACVARHRRRPLSARAWRMVRLHAVALFTLYGGYHVYMFASEVAGW